MAQIKIILADLDEVYLSHLEKKFIDEFGYTAELHVITDFIYLQKFFSDPQSIDILVINQNLYDQGFSRHNISHLFLLAEEAGGPKDEKIPGDVIYKYESAGEIVNSVVNKSQVSGATKLHSEIAKVVFVYSPIGGIGKTTIAAGICALLAKSFRRALLIGVDGLQTFGYALQENQRLQHGIEKTFQQKSPYIYKKVKPMIVSESFDILPPFTASLASLGVTIEHLTYMVNMVKNSGDYDYIVVDGSSEFIEETTKWMAYADQTVILAGQSQLDVFKLNCLLDSIDCSDKNRFLFVCNRYKPEKENFLTMRTARKEYPAFEYIEEDLALEPYNAGYLAEKKNMQKLGQYFL